MTDLPEKNSVAEKIEEIDAENDSEIKINELSISAKNTDDTTSDSKALKKKLKKERQRGKKNIAKERIETTGETDVKVNDEIDATMKKNAKEDITIQLSDDNDDDDNVNISSEDDDIDFLNDAPAFVKSSMISKKNVTKDKKINEDVKTKDSVKNSNCNAKKIFPDERDGFTCVKKGTKQAAVSFPKTPEGFGNQALKVISVGNFPLAIDYLSRAIALDPMDTRHYINRSYCHLRMSNYSEALDDIKFASESFGDASESARAKCRKGQALYGLRSKRNLSQFHQSAECFLRDNCLVLTNSLTRSNYEAAERAFRECIELLPNCMYAKRELLRVQLQQIVNMGFNERDALLALEKHSETMNAIIYLTGQETTNNDAYDSLESATDDEIFLSDTEECPSNEKLMSKILNHDLSLIYKPPAPPSLMDIKINRAALNQPRAASMDRELRVMKTINSQIKSKPSNQTNDKAVWIGNVHGQITDKMLRQRFGKYGKIVKMWRSPIHVSPPYCFITFESSGSAKKALEEGNHNDGQIDVNGEFLPIKHANTKTYY